MKPSLARTTFPGARPNGASVSSSEARCLSSQRGRLSRGRPARWWAALLGGALVITALGHPPALRPLNAAWTALGAALHRVVSPLVMGLLFFAVVLPIGLLMRLFGQRPWRSGSVERRRATGACGPTPGRAGSMGSNTEDRHVLAFVKELSEFLRARRKYWLRADRRHAGPLRRPDRADQGHRGRAVHLHAVLTCGMRILGLSAFYHDSAAALVEDGRIVAAAQEERFTRQEARRPLSPRTPSRYCLGRGGVPARRRRPRRLLRQAVPQVRAAARDLPRLRPARLPLVPPWRCRSGCGRSSSRRRCSATSCAGFDPGLRLEDTRLLFAEHHQSHAASAFFASPFDGGGHPDHGRRRRVGHDLGRRSGRATGSRCARRSTSRTRSACSTPPSPTTPASRSTPASTR